jgi:hypothetical protein
VVEHLPCKHKALSHQKKKKEEEEEKNPRGMLKTSSMEVKVEPSITDMETPEEPQYPFIRKKREVEVVP